MTTSSTPNDPNYHYTDIRSLHVMSALEGMTAATLIRDRARCFAHLADLLETTGDGVYPPNNTLMFTRAQRMLGSAPYTEVVICGPTFRVFPAAERAFDHGEDVDGALRVSYPFPSPSEAANAVNLVINGRGNRVNVIQARHGGVVAEPEPEPPRFWTRARVVGAAIVGLATIAGTLIALTEALF